MSAKESARQAPRSRFSTLTETLLKASEEEAMLVQELRSRLKPVLEQERPESGSKSPGTEEQSGSPMEGYLTKLLRDSQARSDALQDIFNRLVV